MRLARWSLFVLAALAGGVARGQVFPDPALRGKVLFLQCAACHALAPGAPAKVGPNLAGVIGRKAGSVAGFSYSPALAKTDTTWDEATLDRWRTAPARMVPGTIMAFPGLPKAEDRRAVIAWLKRAKP